MASFIITQSIYVLATLLQFSMESALSFTNKYYKSSSIQHRKVKKKKHPICLMSKIPKFDTDSYVIGIDNHSSVSISN